MPRRTHINDLPLDEAWKLPPLTIEQVLQLPVSCPLAHAARACGIGRTLALEMVARAGGLEYRGQVVPVTRVGKLQKVALPELLAALGIPVPSVAPASGDSAA